MNIIFFISNFLPDFYRLREHLFVYVLVLYFLQFKYNRVITDRIVKAIMKIWVGVFIALIFMWQTQPPLKDLIGYWGWVSPIQWSAFTILSYLILVDRLENPTLSFTFTAFAMSAGGYVYELPYFIKDIDNGVSPIMALLKLNQGNIFVMSSQIICIVIVILLLHYSVDFKPNGNIFLALSLVLTGFYYNRFISFEFVRLPMMLFIFAIWSGVNPKCG